MVVASTTRAEQMVWRRMHTHIDRWRVDVETCSFDVSAYTCTYVCVPTDTGLEIASLQECIIVDVNRLLESDMECPNLDS